MKVLALVVLGLGVLFALALLQAQMVVWGLSLFHVDSGIWGPYLLIGAVEGIVTFGVRTGSSSAS